MFRSALRLFLAFALTAMMTDAAFAQAYSEGGYADRTSVAQGSTIAFHVASASTPLTLQIYNLARPADVLATLGNLTSAPSDCSGKWESGCGWPVTATFSIPMSWPSGYYAVRFPTSGGTRYIFFVVRAANPGLASPIVVVSPTNTYIAYNQFGGKSVYDSPTLGPRAPVVSYRRPYHDNRGLGRYPLWEQQLVDWLTAENRPFEVITEDDLLDPAMLGHYNLAVMIGHPEYWTLTARQHVDAFIAAGGHLAVFGGNTMWWQARVDLAAAQFTVYKSVADPVPQRELTTVNWYDTPVFNPENLTLGASFRHAGYANRKPGQFAPLPDEERIPYTVRDAAHWAFSGTGMLNGQQFGRSAAGIEVDGAVFNTLPDGTLLVDGSDGTPANFEIVATLPAESGYGTIGVWTHPSGGSVFNGATRDWSLGLAGDAVIRQMTRNVLDRLSTGEPLPYVARTLRYRTEDRFNTPSPMANVLPGWRRNLAPSMLSAGCAAEGALGLQLTGTSSSSVIRNFAPTNNSTNRATVDLLVNADALQSFIGAFALLKLIEGSGPADITYAAVEVVMQAEGPSLRVASRRTDGTRAATSAPIVLRRGWNDVSLVWRSGAAIQLQVNNAVVQITSPESGQVVNEIAIEYPVSANAITGSMCLDHLRVRDVATLPASAANSTLTADPDAIVADGESISTITVQLRDILDNAVTAGGEDVTVTTTDGTISEVTDRGDGTYTAVLTAPTVTGEATIRATVNGTRLSQSIKVTFVPGAPLLHLDAPLTVTAGEPFTVKVTARDANGNLVTGYDGTVHFAADDATATLPPDYTFQPSDHGTHTFGGAVALRAFGPQRVIVTNPADATQRAEATINVLRPTTTTVSSSPNPSARGAAVTISAKVTAAEGGPAITGTVTFRDGTETLGTATLSNGTATFSTTAFGDGPHSLTATYAGAGEYAGSTSAATTHYVAISAPLIDASAASSTAVVIRWSAVAHAARYQIERRTAGGSFVAIETVFAPALSFTDSAVTANTSYLYRVRPFDSGGNPGALSAPDVATTMVVPIVTGAKIRAADIAALRSAIDTLRAFAGLPRATYTNPTVARGMRIAAIDLIEMRRAADEARNAAGLLPLAYTDALTPRVTPVKALHFRELRDATGAAEGTAAP